ncbi:T9SS type A sorting domain-containing protein [Niastella caeni]|uniref:T9SS type A sorting domain-containing protein n=1 Tax=Niastella caeni TaxID=2569763 RepID=A0A4S8HHP2_9BACT|nr:T9SS type A sorting domain-containing protein [Niastella caeni]THU34041.1 T9SS type A sorting domain-containing protein [Niastella caeni]
MKQLYPAFKTGLYTVKKVALLIIILLYSAVAVSQTLNFNAPILESGTHQQQGCVYRFSAVTTGGQIDALVKVDSLIGVSLSGIDATPSGSSTTALQPQLSSLGGVGYHYAVFTITFVNAGSTTPSPVYNFSSVFMGIDGSNQITEFNAITVNNPSWQYVSPTPAVVVTQDGNTVWGTATNSSPSGGSGIDENDSTQMFQVSTPSTSSVTMRVGYYQHQNGWSGNDLFSLNIRGSQLQPIILPVNLLSFTAQLVNDKVSLIWSTSQEINVSHYSIERSIDNKNFDQVALLFTYDNPSINSYSFKDPIKNITGSVIYYRLKMVDKDGKYKYSEVRTVRINGASERVKITAYPNPVVNELHISLPQEWQNKTVNGQLLNTGGSIIKTFNIQQAATITMSDVPAGTYYIKAINGNEISTQAIVKSQL